MNEYQGVILAAGQATRILPFSEHFPKPLLPVGNKPIIEYQIQALCDAGITEVFMVVGHLKEKLMTYFRDGRDLGVKLTYVEQERTIGIAHALVQLQKTVDQPFVAFLGDVFMNTDRLSEMIELHRESKSAAVLAVKTEKDFSAIKKNFVVIADESRRVSRVIEKPQRDYGSPLKGCGIYVFDPVVFEAAARTPRTAQRNEYELTDAIQILIDWGEKVSCAQAIDWDTNITFPKDLLSCNLQYLNERGLSYLVGDNTNLHDNCRIENSVIGDNVVIDKPIVVKDSLILSNVIMRNERDVSRSIVSPEATVFIDDL